MTCPNLLCPGSEGVLRRPLHPVATWTCASCNLALVVLLGGQAWPQHSARPVVRNYAAPVPA